ncbi:putative monoterpene synthase MTS1, chloroplastic [Drosera capensis]
MLRTNNKEEMLLNQSKCYVHEKGVSIKDAREHMKAVIREHMKAVIKEKWKMYNKAAYNGAPPFSRAFLELVINLPCSNIFWCRNGDAVVNHYDQIMGDLMNTLDCNPEG